MTTTRVAQTSSTAIQQRITSTNFFDGTLPTGDAPVGADYSIYKYSAQAVGGLFFWHTREPLICSQIHISLGGSANVSVYLVNLNPATIDTAPAALAGESMLIAAATGVTYLNLDEARFKMVLLPFQAVQIVTTASAAAQIAQVVASHERSFVR